MFAPGESDRATIARVHIKTGTADRWSVQQSLARLLNTISLRPHAPRAAHDFVHSRTARPETAHPRFARIHSASTAGMGAHACRTARRNRESRCAPGFCKRTLKRRSSFVSRPRGIVGVSRTRLAGRRFADKLVVDEFVSLSRWFHARAIGMARRAAGNSPRAASTCRDARCNRICQCAR